MSKKLNIKIQEVSKELLLDTAEKQLEKAMDNLKSEHPQNVRNYPEIELKTVEVPINMVAVLNAVYFNFVKPFRNQPRLTIPREIAEELLKFRRSLSDPDTELLGWLTITNALYSYEDFSEKFRDWWDESKGETNNLAIAYLNPLTRELVEVVE